MQVNLLHHSRAFKNLHEAFTPRNNVAYAAKFLKTLKNTTNSWAHAVGYYHSKAAKYYQPYCSLVFNEWQKVRGLRVNTSPRVQLASSEVRSYSTFLPSYYSLFDKEISEKLHKLGRKTIAKKPPKFFTNLYK
jgi:soluble lytic murein transglycosylase-like protein